MLKRKGPSDADDSSVPEAKHPRIENGEALAADPIKFLNQDIINLVFSYLSDAELALCERVSREWQEYAREWMAIFGCRLRFPFSWDSQTFHSQSDISAYQLFKQQGMHFASFLLAGDISNDRLTRSLPQLDAGIEYRLVLRRLCSGLRTRRPLSSLEILWPGSRAMMMKAASGGNVFSSQATDVSVQ
jgi:hypothetical protein